MKKSQIAIIDFGSQYTHLITRRIRQLVVLAAIYPPNVKVKTLVGTKGLILSGGPQSVHDKTAISYNKKLFDLSVPILGLCYGHQLITAHFGGQVKPGKVKEYGFAQLTVNPDFSSRRSRNEKSRILDSATGGHRDNLTAKNLLFRGVVNKSQVWMSHGDSVKKLPQGFMSIGRTVDCEVAAMANEEKNIYGLQFHPEVAHSEEGQTILKNFVFDICHCRSDWSIEKYWQEIVKDIKKKVGNKKVFLLVSGGVDSTVCFALLEKVLGKDRVFGLHIDNGFMRLNESKKVKKDLAQAGFDDLVVVNSEEAFLEALKVVTDPETKRRIIGRVFLNIKDDFMRLEKMDHKHWLLGQGTIYPDTIETGGTKHADTIKTHHNRVEEILKIMKMGGLIEPLADLYKDEVREIGKKLKLPIGLIDRHPFPGPGLAIRALCSSGNDKVDKKNQVDKKIKKIVGAKIKATSLPLKSVGVQGDNRTYRHPVLISGQVSWNKLHDLSVRLTNELSEINRAVYLAEPEKINFSQIKVKKADLNKDRLDLLRQVDDLATREIKKSKIYQDIWQFPVVLAPLSLRGGETVILRPIQSKEAMTVNFYQMPFGILKNLSRKILKISGIDMVLYDVTNKPPGTIEWE